jgi:hypothetical protein
MFLGADCCLDLGALVINAHMLLRRPELELEKHSEKGGSAARVAL